MIAADLVGRVLRDFGLWDFGFWVLRRVVEVILG
jgi:hypothetical protein